jgi:hypothetical protein
MIETALHELQAAGVSEKPTVAIADAQYWNEEHMDHVAGEHAIQVLIPPDPANAKERDPAGPVAATRSCGACSQPTSASSSTENVES